MLEDVPEIFYGEPEFEGFFFRAFAGVSSKYNEVSISFKTYGPSLEISMTTQRHAC